MVITLVVLGSGGTIPTLSRHLPAFAIQCDGELFLFDCGEGAQMQFVKAKLSFARLEGIFISHLHGDHIMGLPGLLMTMSQVPRERPLYIVGPPGIAEFVEGNRRFLGVQYPFPVEIQETSGGVLYDRNRVRIRAVPARHSCFTLAFALEEYERPGRFMIEEAVRLGVPEGPVYGKLQKGLPVTLEDGRTILPEQVLGPPRKGRRIVYATDTRPCEEVVRLAQDADLLIHDGMFDDDLRDQAHQKCHSTVVQAAQVARRAGVGQLLLTHLSSRYFSDAPLLEKARNVFPHVIMARDLLEIDVPMQP
ncbi:MAG: ribonuclease Z [candidate division Zixibacteria bacterium]|nr:ribonuclease Z [candidate division Zixibacteria bacterium]